jgi:hypothetical protein
LRARLIRCGGGPDSHQRVWTQCGLLSNDVLLRRDQCARLCVHFDGPRGSCERLELQPVTNERPGWALRPVMSVHVVVCGGWRRVGRARRRNFDRPCGRRRNVDEGGAEWWRDQLSALWCASVSLCVAADFNGRVLASAQPTNSVAGWVTQVHSRGEIAAVSCGSASLCVETAGTCCNLNRPPLTAGIVATPKHTTRLTTDPRHHSAPPPSANVRDGR